MTHPFDQLLDALAETLSREPRNAARATAALYRKAIGKAHKPVPPHHRDRDIKESLDLLASPLSDLVRAAHDFIPWTNSAVLDEAYDALGGLFAAASLIGPEYPISSDHYRAGLFLQFPHAQYPFHEHKADESYFVLAGRGEWFASGTGRDQVPGAIIHHPSRMRHALVTHEEPVLAAWRWSGNIDPTSYRLLNSADSTSGVRYIGNW